MNKALITLTLASSQVLTVTLTSSTEVHLIGGMAGAMAAAQAAEEVKCRTYHLGTGPTPGRGYDDRLTTRTGLGKTELRELGPVRGGLRRVRAGDKWLVREAAVREWFGD